MGIEIAKEYDGFEVRKIQGRFKSLINVIGTALSCSQRKKWVRISAVPGINNALVPWEAAWFHRKIRGSYSLGSDLGLPT